MRPLQALLFLSVILSWTGRVEAQSVSELSWQRVRVTLPMNGFRVTRALTLIGVRGDSVLLQFPTEQKRIAIADLERLEVSRGRDPDGSILEGLLIGTAVGGLATFLDHHFALRQPRHGSSSEPLDFSRERGAVITLSGTALGAVFGALFQRDRWERVRLPGEP